MTLLKHLSTVFCWVRFVASVIINCRWLHLVMLSHTETYLHLHKTKVFKVKYRLMRRTAHKNCTFSEARKPRHVHVKRWMMSVNIWQKLNHTMPRVWAILPIVEQVRLQGKAIRDETYSKEKAHRLVASQDNSLYRGQCTDNPRLVVSLWDIINTLWSS